MMAEGYQCKICLNLLLLNIICLAFQACLLNIFLVYFLGDL